MKTEHIPQLIIAVIMVIMTINGAAAITVTAIGDIATDAEWRKMDSDLALTYTTGLPGAAAQYCHYMASDVTTTRPICAIYGKNSKTVVETCVQPYNNPDDCWWTCNSNTDLCEMDFSAGTVNTHSLPTGISGQNDLELIAITPNEYVFTWRNSTTLYWAVSEDLSADNTSNYTMPGLKPAFSFKDYFTSVGDNSRVFPPFVTFDATYGYVIWDVYYYDSLDQVIVDIYYKTAPTTYTYASVDARTGFCYNVTNTTFQTPLLYYNESAVDDAWFPSDLFAVYDDQSEVLTVKPSCHGYFQWDISDVTNITGISYPSSYSRDIHSIISPLMYLTTGIFDGTFWELNASDEELFMNFTDGNLMYYDNDPSENWLNEESPIYPDLTGFGDYDAGLGENVWATVILQGGSVIYPTSSTAYAIATNLGEGISVNLEGEIDLTTGSEELYDIAMINDDRTYAIVSDGTTNTIIQVETSDDTAPYVEDSKVVGVTGTPDYLRGGARYTAFPSITSERISFGVNGQQFNWWDLRDDNLSTFSNNLNYTESDLKGVEVYSAQEGIQTDITNEYSASTSRICAWQSLDNNDYPYDEAGGMTCYISGFNGFRVRDMDVVASGIDMLVIGGETGTGGSDRGLMFCDSSFGGSVSCDQAGAIDYFDVLPSHTPEATISGHDNTAVMWINTTTFMWFNYTHSTSTVLSNVYCEDPDKTGDVRTVYHFNAAGNDLAIAGTEDGRVLVCDPTNADKHTNTQSFGVGTIGTNSEPIKRITNNEYRTESNGDNFLHVAGEDTYAIMTIGTGAGGGGGYCGDLSCEGGENANNCPADCSPVCGDGYCTHNETSVSCPSDCPVGGGGNETNETYWFPTEDNESDPYIPDPGAAIDLRTLKVVDDDNILVAGTFDGDDEVRKLDISDRENVAELTSGDLIDFPYSVDQSGDRVFVATDDEIHIFTGYSTDNLAFLDRDKWSVIFHNDRAEDYVAINTTNGFVCDNHDEPDYHTVGSDPVGDIEGGCWDIEHDTVKEVIYVDVDDDGIVAWDVSNLSKFDDDTVPPLGFSDFRSGSTGLDAGDLLDYEDDLLLAKRDSNSMTLFDVSNASDIQIITSCNTGGYEIFSVEIINSDIVVGGAGSGTLAVCNVSDTNETTNTDIYSLEGIPSDEDLLAIEQMPNGLIIAMSNTTLMWYNVTTETSTNNTPPTLDNFTVSSTDIDIGEEIDVQIFAGNIEPGDVIWYYIKCEGTESTWLGNTNGEFTCDYDTTGDYDLRVAVSDNFHLGQYYDQDTETITVSEEVFTGGTLRVVVLTQAQAAIENATVLLTSTGENETSTEYGKVTFSTNSSGLFEIYTSKDGYYTDVSNFYADGVQNVVTLYPVATEGDTQLVVTVEDIDGNPVEGALVSYINEFTYGYDYTWSNGLGKAIFTNVDIGDTIVTASKDDSLDTHVVVVIVQNSTNPVTITLTGEDFTGGELRVDRNCIDSGIWLCGDASLVENACTVDEECLSDYCNVATKKCSRFNYSYCDTIDYPRNQQCVYRASGNLLLSNITNWLLGNLLYVIIILIVVIGIGFVVVSWTPKR